MYEVRVEKTTSSNLHDLIESVVNGEEVVFTQDDRPVAKLTAVHSDHPVPKFGSAKGLFLLAEDFDEPLADFGEYRG